jgi:hypothetical protein
VATAIHPAVLKLNLGIARTGAATVMVKFEPRPPPPSQVPTLWPPPSPNQASMYPNLLTLPNTNLSQGAPLRCLQRAMGIKEEQHKLAACVLLGRTWSVQRYRGWETRSHRPQLGTLR